MARKEQIFEYLKERNIPITSLEANSIIEGIRWADNHPKSEMVNKQEFIAKAKSWVKNCFTGPFDEGMANNIADEFEKYMKEE